MDLNKLGLTRKRVLTLVLGVLLLNILLMGTALVVRKCSSKNAPAVIDTTGQIDGLKRLEDIMLGQSSNLLYGIDADQYELDEGEIESGETF